MKCYTFYWSQVLDNPAFAAVTEAGWAVDGSGWAVDPADPASRVSPDVRVDYERESTAWRFREIEVSGTWTAEMQGFQDLLGGGSEESRIGIDLHSAHAWGNQYYAANKPLSQGVRRFDVFCGEVPDYNAQLRGDWDATWGPQVGTLEVGMRDPFWDPFTRLGVLWGMIQLPPYRVIAPPEVGTYGGLVVNMPTWLQIEADAWRPYFTDVDQYMGWYSQLGLFPSALGFEVVGAGGGSVPCAPAESEAQGGAIPGWPDELPRYYELGQLGEDCTWVPQERGEVTIRARITYDVLLTISGYSEWLSPYVWYSDPLTLDVGELRIRNVTPEGGIGE